MPDLETALEAIQPNSDEGAPPDSSGAVAPAVEAPQEQEIRDVENADQPPVGEQPEDLIEKVRQASQDQPGDSTTIKEMRTLLRARLPESQEQPQVDDSHRESMDMVNELFAFDAEKGIPTTQGFVQKLAQKDFNVATQLLMDTATLQVPNSEIQGWTLGHEFLKQIGLDPMKLEELQKYSRGEVDTSAYRDMALPEYIPQEYAEAYQQLNPITRTDVDIYLQGASPEQKAAAMQLLQDKQGRIRETQEAAARDQTAQQLLMSEVETETMTQLSTTYNQLLDSIKTNPAYTQVKVSSNDSIDTMMKDSIISRITALGDDNSVLASRAVQDFKNIGVDIDVPKVQGLLKSIESETVIAVKAEKLGKSQNKDYSLQINQALQRRSTAIAQALALGNKYFSEALSKVNGKPKPGQPADAPPVFEGGTPQETVNTGAKSMADLDAMILSTAKQIREGASAG